MRVRDVEIALVLAREMKDAAARDVDASLRLEQLKEVFGADQLDAGERARIQTALQMAGLEPQPSLLEADPAAPIRFAVAGAETATPPAPAPEAPAEQRQEFPTVGEFARSTFGRFRRKRRGGDEVVAAAELPAPEAEEAEEAEAEAEAPPEEAPAVNGHVDVETNGHSHIDLDDVALPPHETATPADFGASAETVDFDDPRVEEELLYEAEHHDEVEWALEPEPEPLPEPEPVTEPEPEPVAEPEPLAQGARVEEIAALLLPLVAVPVLITSFAGWTFGLPFVALSLIATGILVGRRGGFFSTLRQSAAARTILRTTVLVTAASLAIAIVLASVHTSGGSKTASKPKPPPAAKKPTAPATKHRAAAPSHKPHRRRPPKAATTPTTASPPPDNSTKGLIRVPPSSSGTGRTQTGTQTQTTPVPQQQTP